MQRFTFWAEIEPTATEAEKELKAAVAAGRFCTLEGGGLPYTPDAGTAPAPKRHIRADVLRYFLLGGSDDCAVTELGVGLEGALVTGMLSLTDCSIASNMLLYNCRFQNGIQAVRCKAPRTFQLQSCRLPFLNAGGLEVGKQLVCEGTEFQDQNQDQFALDLNGAIIGGILFLNSTKTFGTAYLGSGPIDFRMAA